MILEVGNEIGPSLMLIEGGLTTIAIAAAFALPRIGSSWFSSIEKNFSRIARRKALSVATVYFAITAGKWPFPYQEPPCIE
jgi:hypothetical protein